MDAIWNFKIVITSVPTSVSSAPSVPLVTSVYLVPTVPSVPSVYSLKLQNYYHLCANFSIFSTFSLQFETSKLLSLLCQTGIEVDTQVSIGGPSYGFSNCVLYWAAAAGTALHERCEKLSAFFF